VARPGVEIETVEVLEHPRRALRERVMMLPLIVINGRRWYHAPPMEEILAALYGVDPRKPQINTDSN
jgi:hypothetical protein